MDWNTGQFFVGAAGALLTLYLSKDEVVPEFRAFYDVADAISDRKTAGDRVTKLQSDVDGARAKLMGDSPPPAGPYADNLRSVLHESEDEIRALQRRETLLEQRILLQQVVSRTLGFLTYVGLGGLFAWLLDDQLSIEGLGGNFEALILGATWSTYVASASFRSVKSRVSEFFNKASDQVSTAMDTAKAQLGPTMQNTVALAERSHPVPTPMHADRAALDVYEQLDATRNVLLSHLDHQRDRAIREVKAAI